MAELHAVSDSKQTSISLPGQMPVPPEAVPQIAGAGPLWRSLLHPSRGQRAVEFGHDNSDLFASLHGTGVRCERAAGQGELVGARTYDLVLEDRSSGRPPIQSERARALLVPGGRWVAVIEKKPWVGLSGRREIRAARRSGFERVETFCAYPSLRSPRILVPVDSLQTFRYFLNLAVGVHGPRQRLFGLGARLLCALRMHRIFLPNLIVVARRKG